MAKITKAMQIEEYCNNLRRELGIEKISYNCDIWHTMLVTDNGLYQFSDNKAIVALYKFFDTISADVARKLGGRQYKKSTNEYLVGVCFNNPMNENAVWNYMNGKAVKLPRVYSSCIKYIPVVKGEMFEKYNVNDDGLIEISLTADKLETFGFSNSEIPRTGEVALPMRLRLSGELPTGPIEFKTDEYKHYPLLEFECGGSNYLLGVISDFDTNVITSDCVKVNKWRARKDDKGVYLDVIAEFKYKRR